MIIVACRDDNQVYRAADIDSHTQPRIFGRTYLVFDKKIPKLGVHEDLFITAHGACNFQTNSDGILSVIGDEATEFWISGGELYVALKNIFPPNYTGKVYVSACESSDRSTVATKSFVEYFKKVSGLRYVYGQSGEVNYQIPLPGDRQWNRAVTGSRS